MAVVSATLSDVAVDVTLSSSSLGSSFASARATRPSSMIARRVSVCVPLCENVTSYVPGGNSLKKYVPRGPVVVVRSCMSADEFAVTVTPSAARSPITTRPVSAPRSVEARTGKARRRRTRSFLID